MNDETADITTVTYNQLVLPDRYTGSEMQIVAKTDEHYDSMVSDSGFYADMVKMNDQANQLQNLNNPALTQAGDNAAQNGQVLIENTNEHWINTTWRPAMSWMYMMVCVFDFIIFPIAWSALQAIASGSVTTPWQPITLQGAGFFHIAMGTVLGVATWGRTQEKVAVTNNPASPTGTTG